MSQYYPQLSILWHDSRLGCDSNSTGGHWLEDALKGTIVIWGWRELRGTSERYFKEIEQAKMLGAVQSLRSFDRLISGA